MSHHLVEKGMNSHLPIGLREKAFQSRNGELAWRRDDVPSVLKSYREANVAVEGFEVWIVTSGGQWTAVLPNHEGEYLVCVYDVKERLNEAHEQFVARCAEEILSTIHEFNIEERVREDLIPFVRYNLKVPEKYYP